VLDNVCTVQRIGGCVICQREKLNELTTLGKKYRESKIGAGVLAVDLRDVRSSFVDGNRKPS